MAGARDASYHLQKIFKRKTKLETKSSNPTYSVLVMNKEYEMYFSLGDTEKHFFLSGVCTMRCENYIILIDEPPFSPKAPLPSFKFLQVGKLYSPNLL